MIASNSTNFFWLVIVGVILNTSSCSAGDKSKEVLVGNNAVCELRIGSTESSIPSSFKKVSVYTEEGESYIYRGLICNYDILADISINDKSIDKISIIDSNACNGRVCIGDSFRNTKKHLTHSKLYFSGEEGGLFSLEGPDGVSYIFSTADLDISCYIDSKKCENEINTAKLTAIVISRK